MSQKEVPTIEDLESVIRYCEDVGRYVRAFHPAELSLLKAREVRFRNALTFLVTGDEPPEEGRLTLGDCAWVVQAQDASPDDFPEGCAERFKALQTFQT